MTTEQTILWAECAAEMDAIPEVKEMFLMCAASLRKAAEYDKAESEGRLVVLNTAAENAYSGLRRKYIVFKADSGQQVNGCFVLRPDKDGAAIAAQRAYADACRDTNPELACDISCWLIHIRSDAEAALEAKK